VIYSGQILFLMALAFVFIFTVRHRPSMGMPLKIAPAFLRYRPSMGMPLKIAPAFLRYRPSMGIKKARINRAFLTTKVKLKN